MVSRKLTIRGSKWNIILYTRHQFDIEHKEHTNALAITMAETKTIAFQDDNASIVVVRHELFHAYMAESYLNDCDLDAGAFEEAAAEVIGNWLPALNKQSNMLHKWLNKSIEEKKHV